MPSLQLLPAPRPTSGSSAESLGQVLGARLFTAPERALAGLAAGTLGDRRARPLGEGRRLAAAGPLEGLDLGAEGGDLGRLSPDQGDQSFAIQVGEVRPAHGPTVRARPPRGKGVGN